VTCVSIAKCDDYDRERVRAAVRECLGRLDGLSDLLRGKKVLLKPNLLSSTATPEKDIVNTHVEIIRAVAELLLGDFGCTVRIGDSCGRVAPGANQDAFENSGLIALAKEMPIELVDFNTAPSERVTNPQAEIMREFYVPRAVLETDVLFNLPKLKTHQLTYMTGGVKNMLGVIPGRGKKLVHLAAPKPEAMAVALVDIFQRVTPHIALMDAIDAMEGNGPNSGAKRRVGLLIASRDSVALDAVAAAAVGFNPGDIPTTVLAEKRGLGVGELGKIDVRGESLGAVRVPDFKKPMTYGRAWVAKLIPASLLRGAVHLVSSYRSVIDDDACVRCGQCIANCPVKRLQMRNKCVVATEGVCIACYCCEEVCDYDAIRIVRSPLVRAFAATRRLFRKRKVRQV
jgi:uncharacterized protein (DUF362 family)/Pyruvate/2-oxoacid:ferredoxin oxidoreductase delta subunit